MKKLTHFVPLSMIAALSACATATPPSITTGDVAAAEAELARIAALPATAPTDLPSGTFTYEGQIGGDFSDFSDVEGGFLGDMEVEVAFDTGDIDGDVTNINIIDDGGVPEQLLSGSLDIDGSVSGADVDMTATGRLTGVDGGFKGSSDVDLALDGGFVTDASPGDAMIGSVSGSGDGDFFFTLDGGGFYASTD